MERGELVEPSVDGDGVWAEGRARRAVVLILGDVRAAGKGGWRARRCSRAVLAAVRRAMRDQLICVAKGAKGGVLERPHDKS